MSDYTPTEAEQWLVDGFVRGANYAPADKLKAEELIESIKAQIRADERAKRPDREQIALGVAGRLNAEARPWGESPRGEDWFDLALSAEVREMIETVYADCGDSDPRVLSSNIGRMLAPRLLDALDAVLSSLALEPEAREEASSGVRIATQVAQEWDKSNLTQEEAAERGKELAAPEAREVTDAEVEAREELRGRVVTASFETGGTYDCGLTNADGSPCECPDHEFTPEPGTYITVKLDQDYPVGLGEVVVTYKERA